MLILAEGFEIELNRHHDLNFQSFSSPHSLAPCGFFASHLVYSLYLALVQHNFSPTFALARLITTRFLCLWALASFGTAPSV